MPNFKSIAISFLVLGVGGLVGCAVDDSVAPEGKGGAAGTIGVGTAGRAGSSGPTTSVGGRAGSFGVAGSGGATAGSGGSIGGNAGEGGSAGAGGRAGTAGTGGSSGAGGTKDAAIDTGADTKPPEAGPPDVVAPDDVMAEPACAAESDSDFCARSHKNCGSFLGLDNCGTSRRALACGTCLGAGSVCGGSGTLNVCSGTEPVNRAQGGSVLSTNPTSPPFFAMEGDVKVFDNDITTKWYVRGNPTPAIVYDFAGTTSYAINAYTVTSGNDAPDRDPASWRLEGSNSPNLSTWTTVDTRTGQTFVGRGQTNYYSFANTTGYLVYRFVVTANNGGTANGGEFQMAELQLFGDPTTPPPDDGGTDAAPAANDAASDASSASDAGTDSSID